MPRKTKNALPIPAPTDQEREAELDIQLGDDRLRTPAYVADWLGVSKRVLERWRMTGHGPHFVKPTRKTVRYPHGEVRRFIKARTVASTAAQSG